MAIELKCKCGNNSFKVIKNYSCGDCLHNGFWDNKALEYIYVSDPPGPRTECEYDGQCDTGDNYNQGCHIYICSKCEQIVDHLPFVECD